MPTFWIGDMFAVVTGSTAEALKLAEETSTGVLGGVTVIPLKEHRVCSTCPWQEACDQSSWNEIRRGFGVQPSAKAELTSVHTCCICLRKVLDSWGGEPRGEVPEECPRWNPVSGSALDCPGCRAAKAALEKTHPSYEAKFEAISRISRNLMGAVKAKIEGVADPAEDERKVAIHDFVEACTPEYSSLSPLAVEMVDTLFADLRGREAQREVHPGMNWRPDPVPFSKVWDEAQPDQQLMCYTEICEWMTILYYRHRDDPDLFLKNLVMVVLEHPLIRRFHNQMSFTQKTEVRVEWRDLFTPYLDPGEV